MLRSLKDFTGRESIFIDANIFLHHAFDTNATSIGFLKSDRVTPDAVKHLLRDNKNREKEKWLSD
ncbi:MAG TPA: hypothetical protein EYP21_04235 [Syntrophaceae bacterium]|nr:hypothetical protein [Syntrophaceae bacterium]